MAMQPPAHLSYLICALELVPSVVLHFGTQFLGPVAKLRGMKESEPVHDVRDKIFLVGETVGSGTV